MTLSKRELLVEGIGLKITSFVVFPRRPPLLFNSGKQLTVFPVKRRRLAVELRVRCISIDWKMKMRNGHH